MNKRIKWVLIILAIVIAASFLGRGIFFLLFSDAQTWGDSADYDQYAQDFQVVKDYIQAQYPGAYDKYLSVGYKDSVYLYDPETGEYLQLPSEVLSSLEAIDRHGFPSKDARLDVIRIHGDRITFCTTNGQYALVFSPSRKPTWVNSPDETVIASVKPIGDGWYHVATRAR